MPPRATTRSPRPTATSPPNPSVPTRTPSPTPCAAMPSPAANARMPRIASVIPFLMRASLRRVVIGVWSLEDPDRHEGSDPGQQQHVRELERRPLPPGGLATHDGDRGHALQGENEEN